MNVLEKVEKRGQTECWCWRGRRANGYSYSDDFGYVHKYLWVKDHGRIPKNMYLLNRCGNIACCNPAHWYLGDAAEKSNKGYRTKEYHVKNRGIANKIFPYVPDSVLAKIEVVSKDKCCLWKSNRDRAGYGNVHYMGRMWMATRLVWTMINGPIPEGLYVLHKCDNPPCVNPNHLFIGSAKDNSADMIAKGRQNALFGERVGNSRLKESQVKEILQSNMSQGKLAKLFNVSKGTICAIKSGRTWKHVRKKCHDSLCA